MERISKLFLELRQGRTALEKAFYRSLDTSLIRSGILYGPAFRVWPLMGEGRHFQCFRLKSSGALDLAVLVAKPSFQDGDDRRRQAWKNDLSRLKKLDHPLIPPMEVIEDNEFFAYVQPFCEQDLVLSDSLKAAWEDLLRSMAQIGLELDDYPQLRSCQGQALVIDFSELKRLSDQRFRL